MMIRRLTLCFAFAGALLATSCAKHVPPADKSAPRDDRRPLLVSAAASTLGVVEALAAEFRKTHDVEVQVNAGPSNSLATQILAGAPADLFLSASAKWADELQTAGHAAESVRLLTNELVIVVPRGNPAQVHGPQDLLSDRVTKLALAGEQVPAGTYADQVLDKLDLLKQLADGGKIARGQDVRSTLSYVERGEAEAGIVYSTDADVAREVEAVYRFDPQLHDEIVYVLLLTKEGASRPAARELFKLFQSPAANDVYTRFGFTRLD